MAVKPLEQIMSDTENIEAYRLLSDNYAKLIPYVGTGLSFFFYSWGAPFCIIWKNLKGGRSTKECFFRELNEEEKKRVVQAIGTYVPKEVMDGITVHTLCVYIEKALEVINQELEEADRVNIDWSSRDSKIIWRQIKEKIYDKELYLVLGEVLNIICLTIQSMTFNQMFFLTVCNHKNEAMDNVVKEKKDIQCMRSLDYMGALPPSRWFMPYLGNNVQFVITTNTDNSLQYIYSAVYNKEPSQYSCLSNITDLQTNFGRALIVYHIHGFQPADNTDTSDSFIMTWSDYRKTYKSNLHTSPIRELTSKFTKEHMLFIGASLRKDETVKLMKSLANVEHAIHRHVAFFSTQNKNVDEEIANANELCAHMATQSIITETFDAYSQILCQVIREENNKEWGIYKEIIKAEKCTDNEYKTQISTFLNADGVYDEYKFILKESDLAGKLYPVLKEYVYDEESRYRSFNWAICRIEKDDFDFPIKKIDGDRIFLDSYSAPLGNTIYIIGGASTTNEGVKELKNRIQKWTEEHKDKYWSDDQEVKVRIFIVNDAERIGIEFVDTAKMILLYNNIEEYEDKIKDVLCHMCRVREFAGLFSQEELKCITNNTLSKQELLQILVKLTCSSVFKGFFSVQEQMQIQEKYYTYATRDRAAEENITYIEEDVKLKKLGIKKSY